MPNLLALDTSGNSCSVAVWQQQDGQAPQVFSLHEAAQRSHTQRLLPMVQEVLDMAGMQQSELHAIVYGRGPGSFTGIRIAAGVAQGLAFALDIPLIPVSTLAAMALQAEEANSAAAHLCCLDARMNEVYSGCYKVDLQTPELVQELQPEAVLSPVAVVQPEMTYTLSGSGVEVADFPAQVLANAMACDAQLEPMAKYMVQLGAADLARGIAPLPEHALPVYLRDEVTWQKLPRYQ
jgi:tRNA threonylcarbamoyladenosine biosynthesis protein TsaB